MRLQINPDRKCAGCARHAFFRGGPCGSFTIYEVNAIRDDMIAAMKRPAELELRVVCSMVMALIIDGTLVRKELGEALHGHMGAVDDARRIIASMKDELAHSEELRTSGLAMLHAAREQLRNKGFQLGAAAREIEALRAEKTIEPKP